uniref:ABC transmembrane type-1 domain-containing protein n=1 Tax=Oryza rufipogon TaxID=4529 RepID=A0A0E0N8D0_ORYRU
MPESWRDAEANASAAAPPSSASVAAADSSLGNGKGGGGAAARGERAASAASASAWVPFHFHKLFAFADKTDVALMALGTLGAVANGAALPFMTVLFGNLIDAVNRVSMVSLEFIYLAIASSVASFVQVTCWMIPGERQAARIRNLCLKTILRQEIAIHDNRLLRQVHQHRRGRRQDVRRHHAHTGRHGGGDGGASSVVVSAAAAAARRLPVGVRKPPLHVVVTGERASSAATSSTSSRGDSVIIVDNLFTGRKENFAHHLADPRFELIRRHEPHPLPARPRKPRPSGPRIRLCLLCLAVVGGRLLIPHHRRVRFTRFRP